MTRLSAHLPLRGAVLALGLALVGCSTIENFVAGDKIDYRTAGNRTPGLEVPPDLTQLARDSRYLPAGGAVSAAAIQSAASAPATVQSATTVAPSQIGDVRIERQGSQRWLVTSLTPEQLWPRLQAFWKDNGFTLAIDQAATGIMETEWNENRAKLPQDVVRSTIGRVFDSLYSTGERDKFRTRVERTPAGSEVYISHRGAEEVYTSAQKESTVWQPRPADPQLEATFLARLMARLGVSEETAKTAVASAPVPPARARIVPNQPGATLQVDDSFERAWRRVGLALDRRGFTVEDRDRAQGLYFVRYIDPKDVGKTEPGFFAKLFGRDEAASSLARYRILVKADGERANVSVQNAQGAPEPGETGQRIVALLLDELK
ncbi:outer membrane protein assembly factor BamC [uncultured Piscinibacter sp.]|uniref:outer membrane protein assembly factor BamC n=1 Tax=uncultured Piscinibacter sp. TaxID=1131835 RepID=UPI002616DB38|nr:outer membrane protein assembly factor BamC [uncultured Piscinibacter sp.]